MALVVGVLVSAANAHAQQGQGDPAGGEFGDKAREEIAGVAKNSKGIVPNPLLTEPRLQEQNILNSNPPKQAELSLKVPAMEGLQQIASSQSVKKMLQNLVKSDVSVFYQTMMMVENGAATGFMHSMDTVGSLLSNTMQSSQLQMQIFDARDPSGEKKLEYLAAAYKSATTENKNFWPAALWWASGDRVETPAATPPPVKDNPEKTGSNAGDTSSSSSGSTSGKKEALLSERIFKGSYGTASGNMSGPPEPGDIRPMLNDAMLDWLGDYKITDEQTSDITLETRGEWIKAKKYEQENSTPGGGANGDIDKSSVYELFRKKTREYVWKHFNEAMKQYCEFKQKNNVNSSADILQKKMPSSAIQDDTWEKIFSIDIRPSINLIDQLFKLFMARRPIEEVDCNDFKGTPDTMPESGNASASTSSSFDSCQDSPKTCLRNVILYRIVQFITESQLNYYYRWLWEGLFSHTPDETNRYYLSELFCVSLRLPWPCEPNHEFNIRLEDNRAGWIEFSNKLSKFAQGQGGSTVFKPAEDHSPIGAVAAVGAGN